MRTEHNGVTCLAAFQMLMFIIFLVHIHYSFCRTHESHMKTRMRLSLYEETSNERRLQERPRGCGGGKPEKPASLLSFFLILLSVRSLGSRRSHRLREREKEKAREITDVTGTSWCIENHARRRLPQPQVRETRKIPELIHRNICATTVTTSSSYWIAKILLKKSWLRNLSILKEKNSMLKYILYVSI